MNKATFFIGFGVFTIALWVNPAEAAPIAPKAPVTQLGENSVLRADGPCPDERDVGVPAYPDSVCLKAATFDTFTAFVNLMTADNASKVADWYAKHLRGWTKTRTLSGNIVFTPPGERTNPTIAAFTKVHVLVEKLDNVKSKLKKSFYVFKGTPASLVSIHYSTLGHRK